MIETSMITLIGCFVADVDGIQVTDLFGTRPLLFHVGSSYEFGTKVKVFSLC